MPILQLFQKKLFDLAGLLKISWKRDGHTKGSFAIIQDERRRPNLINSIRSIVKKKYAYITYNE